jgi:hypothetical protein
MGWWKELFIKRAADWVFSPLAASQVPEEPRTSDIIPIDEAYLGMTLRSMRIVNVRKMTTKFYGVVHSYTTLSHLSGTEAAFHTVTTPTELRNIDPQHIDRVIQVNMPLLGPIPYRGGPVGLELGLFSVKEADLAAPFIDVLVSAASKAGIAVVSAALPFIEPLKKGIDAITGADADAILEVGLSTNLDPLKTGWYVVMRAPKQDINISRLSVTPEDFRLVDADTNQLVQNYPYMLFTVSYIKQRPDWFTLPDLSRPYQEIQTAARSRDYNTVKELIIAFKRRALTSDDLITDDAVRIATLVKERAERAMDATLTARGAPDEQSVLPPLESYPLYAPNSVTAS